MAAIALFVPPGVSVGTSFVPATYAPSPVPATIPISFLSDIGAPAGQIVNTDGVVTGIPFTEDYVIGGESPIELPLPPLPTVAGARVSIPPGSYGSDYQTAGSNLIVATDNYNGELSVYNTALATFLASASYATYLAATATYTGYLNTFLAATVTYDAAVTAYETAYGNLLASSAWQTWNAAGQPLSGAEYTTYLDSAAFATWQSAISTWIAAGGSNDASGNPGAWLAAAQTFEAAIGAVGTYFYDAFIVYDDAYITFIEADAAWATAAAVWDAAGSPGSGAAYDAYEAAIATFNTATQTFNAAAVTYANALNLVSDSADETAGGTLSETSDWQTYVAAWGVVASAYNTYVATANVAQSALNWWTTYANAVNFFNRNRLAANPYSSANPV